MTDGAAAVSKNSGGPDPLIGRVINDRFKINALIARGGMGRVYRAEQAPLGRVCAIKVLNPNYAGDNDPEFHKRFFLEASIASKLTHPNTVTIFDYGKTDDEIYYMAMEYLEGHTLHRAIREAGFFPEERTAHVCRQICRALREAHSLGVIHRDLKPANIFLVEHGDETDFVKVLDFGLVKNVSGNGEDLTQTGLFMGSPKYMAPEQIRGDKVDARTDIYALGIIMYEMITGKVPFDHPNSVNILMAHVNETPAPLKKMNPNVNVSPALEDTLQRCIAKDPDQRFRSMDEVLASLKRIGAGAATGTIGATGEFRPTAQTGTNATSGSGSHPTGSGVIKGSPSFLSGTDPSASIPSPLAMSTSSPSAPMVALPAGKSGSKGMLAAAVVGALAIAGIIGVVALRPTKPSTPAPQAATTVTSPTTTTTPADTTPPAAAQPTNTAPALVKVRVNSDPDGASVKEDGVEVCSATPCDIPYKGGDADPTKDHKLTFSRSGYRNESKTVKVGDSPVTVKLTAAPVYIPRGTKNTDSPAVPGGYKPDLPY